MEAAPVREQHDMPWIKVRPDMSHLVEEMRKTSARIVAERAPYTHFKRKFDPSLLDIDAVRSKLLPFCDDAYHQVVRRVAKMGVMFLATKHYTDAVNLGWSAADIFGVLPGMAADADQGLISSMCTTPFSLRLKGVDRDGAKFGVLNKRTGMLGSILVFRAHPFPRSTPIWDMGRLPMA